MRVFTLAQTQKHHVPHGFDERHVGRFVQPDSIVLRTAQTVGFFASEDLNDVLVVLFLILGAEARQAD
jgi:hypothetical protein